MDLWNDYAYPKIAARAKRDEIYLELQRENRILEQEYMKIVENLVPSEQEMVERYIASCEAMEFRFAQIAYRIGLSENN